MIVIVRGAVTRKKFCVLAVIGSQRLVERLVASLELNRRTGPECRIENDIHFRESGRAPG